MPSEADYRSQAEALLRLAAATENMRDRSDLIDEATRWNALAAKARAKEETGLARRPPERASFADPDVYSPRRTDPRNEDTDELRRDERRSASRRRASPLRWFLGLS